MLLYAWPHYIKLNSEINNIISEIKHIVIHFQISEAYDQSVLKEIQNQCYLK